MTQAPAQCPAQGGNRLHPQRAWEGQQGWGAVGSPSYMPSLQHDSCWGVGA